MELHKRRQTKLPRRRRKFFFHFLSCVHYDKNVEGCVLENTGTGNEMISRHAY